MTSSFRDILVTPYSDLLGAGPGRDIANAWIEAPNSDRTRRPRASERLVHRGGPHWPDFDLQSEARHRRSDRCVDDEPEYQAAQHHLGGEWAWAGPISSHFGHQLLEFSTRIMPTLVEDVNARFLFAVPPFGRYRSIDQAPQFFRDVLEWFGVDTSRCHVIAAPTAVDELSVAGQAEQLGGPGPSEHHLDVLDALSDRRLGLPEQRGVVYVSRAGLSARFCGEALLEESLEACGVHVLRPETVPLARQLEAYASARLLIFAEGSAMHGPTLLGRTFADIVVLARRPGSRLAQKSLSPRARSLRYVDAIEQFIPGKWLGESADFTGLTILDEEMLLGVFDSLDIPVRRHWDTRRYAERRTQELQAQSG